jgi:hypothetical protein
MVEYLFVLRSDHRQAADDGAQSLRPAARARARAGTRGGQGGPDSQGPAGLRVVLGMGS